MSLHQRKKEIGSAKNFFAACILFYLNNLYFATVKDESERVLTLWLTL
jgi:hypothetical protein